MNKFYRNREMQENGSIFSGAQSASKLGWIGHILQHDSLGVTRKNEKTFGKATGG